LVRYDGVDYGMKILFLHELDTGFMAATLKPAFEKLGHECIIMQGWNSFLEGENIDHIDYLLSEMPKEDKQLLLDEFEDTDLFILRCGDDLMRGVGVIPYVNSNNSVYRLHGHDITHLGRPYKLKTWRIDWYGNEPTVVTYKDPTFIPHLKSVPIYIERPINIDIIPKKRRGKEVFALTTPSNYSRKGADTLLEEWIPGDIKLTILSGTDREEVLALKKKCSYFIDNLNEDFNGGPYGMNSVEAWIIGIPVFSRYTTICEVMCPELPRLVHNVTASTVQEAINNYEYNRKDILFAKRYALDTHSAINIAKQYIALYKGISSNV
jgi:hypothetical protein